MVTIVDVDATWVNPDTVEYTAEPLRLADAALFAGRGDAYGASGGIVRHADDSLEVSIDGSDIVSVQPGSVVIPGTALPGTGVYRAGIGDVATGSIDARDATNPRVDLVVFRQLDTDVEVGHADYTARIEVITGTPSGSPSAPALPSMAVELGRITVPASGGGAATVNLSNRTYVTAIGGEIAVPSAAKLPAAAVLGQRAIALDTLRSYLWDGDEWSGEKSTIPRVLSSHVNTPLSGAWGDITGLAFDVEAGEIYEVEFIGFLLNGSSAPKWRHGWSFSGTGEISSAQTGLATSVVAPNFTGDYSAHAIQGTSFPLRETTGLGVPANTLTPVRVSATVFATSAGTVQMQHRQHVSDGTWVTQVRKGSRLKVTPIG